MLSSTLQQFLERMNLPYALIRHPSTSSLLEAAEGIGIPMSRLARAVILADQQGLVMAVLPGDHLLDFDALTRRLGRRLRPVSLDRIASRFADCAPGSIPPVAAPYDFEAVVDERLADLDAVYLEPGSHDTLLCLEGRDFQSLHATSLWGRIARPVQALASHDAYGFVLPEGIGQDQWAQLCPPEDIQRRIEQQQQLPAMPEMAHQLLRLRNDPRTTIAQLGATLARDPSLGAQIVRYATSAYYGYRGPVQSIEQATRVLGFETVLNMALGLAAGRTFDTPRDGPIGLHAFWRHAIHSATLCQGLATLAPRQLGLKRGLAWLAGLLHNLGFLLLGHLFKPEFFLLNKTVELNPEVLVTLVERRLLGIDHTRLGAALLQAWDMPAELTTAVREHHNEQYSGEHAAYARLVLVADQLLRGYGIGDGAAEDPPPQVLTALGLDLDAVLRLTQQVVEDAGDLNGMARQLAG
jgi:HD-like signal output (HDOD) protein/prolyl-tRNA editing enzyme YbaK/EbsC (Cys-tRNA(Pro) deacylase)